MSYGTPLKQKSTYVRIFSSIASQIRDVVGSTVIIEHVGGTSLKKPSGKGDIDIYVIYKSKKEMKSLQSTLTTLFGTPAKIHPSRIRYNLFVDGVEVEIQLASAEETGVAMMLRDYLNSNQSESKLYADGVATLRQQFLAKMFKFKKRFAEKASKVSRKKNNK